MFGGCVRAKVPCGVWTRIMGSSQLVRRTPGTSWWGAASCFGRGANSFSIPSVAGLSSQDGRPGTEWDSFSIFAFTTFFGSLAFVRPPSFGTFRADPTASPTFSGVVLGAFGWWALLFVEASFRGSNTGMRRGARVCGLFQFSSGGCGWFWRGVIFVHGASAGERAW